MPKKSRPTPVPDGQTARDFIRRMLADDLLGRRDPAGAALEDAAEKCRAGNPFPLIGLQWPHLLITDEAEIAIFRDNLRRVEASAITDDMKAAIFDSANPVLRLDWWQYIIAAGMFAPDIGEIAIKGNVGAGKGCAVSIGVNLWFDVFPECRLHLTGRDFTHATMNIWGEVRDWRTKATDPSKGRLLSNGLAHTERHYIRILNPDPTSPTAGEAFSGAHGANTLYIFDEATSAPDSFFSNAEKNARMIVSLANPRTMAGRFRNAFEKLPDIDQIGIVPGNLRMRLCVTVGGPDCINVARSRLREPVGPKGGIEVNGRQYEEGQVIRDAADQTAVRTLIDKQIDLAKFRTIISSPDKKIEVPVFGYGRFPTEDPEKQVILGTWLARHEAAWNDCGGRLPITCFGMDVARSAAGNRTALAAGSDAGCAAIHAWNAADVIFHVNEAIRIARENYGIDLTLGQHPVCIDYGGGYGAGVGDPLRSMGVWVIEFHPSSSAVVMPRVYRNLRTEGYALLGRRLDPNDQWKDQAWALPPDDQLRRGLIAPEKVYGADAIRFIIEPKDGIKEKLNGQSPDEADSVVYLWHAVREFHSLNSYYASIQGDLTTWPPPQTPGGLADADDGEDEFRGLARRLRADFDRIAALQQSDANPPTDPNAHPQPAAGEWSNPRWSTPSPTSPPPANEAARLLDYLEGEYGSGGDPRRPQDDDDDWPLNFRR